MNIQTIEVAGFGPATMAMRNPMNSWNKNDTYLKLANDNPDEHIWEWDVGPNDKDLSLRLQKAGPEHCKHLRMIMVWADIAGSLTFWKQFDTYRAGVEKISTSTMHKLMSRPLTPNDFESIQTKTVSYWPSELMTVIGWINDNIEKYKNTNNEEDKKIIWQETVNLLPESYLQKRTVMLSYAALRNIVRQRKGHKLGDWLTFINWVKTLPNSWMIFDEEEEDENSEN